MAQANAALVDSEPGWRIDKIVIQWSVHGYWWVDVDQRSDSGRMSHTYHVVNDAEQVMFSDPESAAATMLKKIKKI